MFPSYKIFKLELLFSPLLASLFIYFYWYPFLTVTCPWSITTSLFFFLLFPNVFMQLIFLFLGLPVLPQPLFCSLVDFFLHEVFEMKKAPPIPVTHGGGPPLFADVHQFFTMAIVVWGMFLNSLLPELPFPLPWSGHYTFFFFPPFLPLLEDCFCAYQGFFLTSSP